MGTKRSDRNRKLRRQPKMRRVNSRSILSMPRLEIPRTARRRRRRNKWPLRLPTAALKKVFLSSRWVSLFLMLMCVGSLVLVGMDEGFYLTTIPVEGVASIPPAEIVEASGLGGAHIFAVDPAKAARRINAIPGVISATVTLEWPNSAHVSLREETPVAVWEQGDKQYWVTENGRLVPARTDVPGLLHIRADENAPANLPVETIPAVDESSGAADDLVEVTQPYVPQDVLEGALQLRRLRPNIDVLRYDIGGGLSYEDGRGWRAFFGTGSSMAQKLAVYETLVEHLLQRGTTPVYISVSNHEKPYYMAGSS